MKLISRDDCYWNR